MHSLLALLHRGTCQEVSSGVVKDEGSHKPFWLDAAYCQSIVL